MEELTTESTEDLAAKFMGDLATQGMAGLATKLMEGQAVKDMGDRVIKHTRGAEVMVGARAVQDMATNGNFLCPLWRGGAVCVYGFGSVGVALLPSLTCSLALIALAFSI